MNEYFGILGLGVSGNATVQFMVKHGYKFIVWDDNLNARENCLKILKLSQDHVKFCSPESKEWKNVTCLIASPGIANLNQHKIFENTDKDIDIICDVELFYRHFPNQKYIAITGTNGKSTTTKLTEHILKCSDYKAIACGNIGLPILSIVPEKNDIIVLEMSSYQLDLIKEFKPSVSVILNITPDHLDRHGSMANYIEAKKRIFLNQTLENTLILNIDNEILLKTYKILINKNQLNLIPISSVKILSQGVSSLNNIIHDNIRRTKINIPRNKNLRGVHNLENIMAAYAASVFIVNNSFKRDNIIKAIETYPGLIHRLQFLGIKNNVEFINDSKGTNAQSVEKALNSLEDAGDIYLIAGGLAKEEGIETIKKNLQKNVKYVFLVGEAQDKFAQTLDEINIKYKLSNTLDMAFRNAMEIINKQPKDRKKILLLSPACASFDQWKSFDKRGDRFIELVDLQLK